MTVTMPSLRTSTDDITAMMLQKLDEQQNELKQLDEYYSGTQPYAFLSPEVRDDLKDRLDRIVSNVPRLVVTSLAERLRIIGIRRDGQADDTLWRMWLANDMDEFSAVAHREALKHGASYVTVWADNNVPRITVESAHQMVTVESPSTGQTLAALKRWEEPNLTDPHQTRDIAVLYLPERILWYEANPGTSPMAGAWRQTREVRNPLGQVPVVPIRNSDELLDDTGTSEMRDVIPLADALNKLLLDLMVTSEFYARPRRWGSGIELIEEEDEEGQKTGEVRAPFDVKGHDAWITEAPDARFGNFDPTNLSSYETGCRVIVGQIMAVTTLPAHYLGVFSNAPVSADSIRASEASLVARAHARIRTFSRSWEKVYRLMYAAMGSPLPIETPVSAQWDDPASRTTAQEADAASKLVQAGVLDVPTALEGLGYSAEEIDQIMRGTHGSTDATA